MKSIFDMFREMIKKNPWAFNITILSTVVFVLLLLFHKGLTPYVREVFIPSLGLYIIGTAFISGIRIEFTVYDNTKAERPEGIKPYKYALVIILHFIFFFTFIIYNICSFIHY